MKNGFEENDFSDHNEVARKEESPPVKRNKKKSDKGGSSIFITIQNNYDYDDRSSSAVIESLSQSPKLSIFHSTLHEVKNFQEQQRKKNNKKSSPSKENGKSNEEHEADEENDERLLSRSRSAALDSILTHRLALFSQMMNGRVRGGNVNGLHGNESE